MGLFDKIKKKDNEVSQKNENEVVTQVAEGVGTEAPVEGSQTIMTEVSVDNNPFVEEITPVEESQVAPQPEGPSFDNIFNATPGDLIMPESAPVVEVQPQQDLQIENVNNEVGQSNGEFQVPIIEINESELVNQPIIESDGNPSEVSSFTEEQTKEDEITQIVSESVAASELAESEVAESASEVEGNIMIDKAEENVIPQTIEEIQVAPEVIASEETPIVEQNIEQPIQAVENIMEPAEAITENTIEQVEQAPSSASVEMPVSEEIQPETIEEPESLEEAEPIIELTSEPVESNQNYQEEVPLNEEPIENLEETITEVSEEPIDFNVAESFNQVPIIENSFPEDNTEQSNESENIDTTFVEQVENIVPIEEQNEEIVELSSEQATNDNSLEIEVPSEEIIAPPIEMENAENVALTETSEEENVQSIISNNIENEEVEQQEDIIAGEAIIPEEIAANQENIIELSSEKEEIEENEPVELTNEPVAELTEYEEQADEENQDIVIQPEISEVVPLITEETSEINISNDSEEPINNIDEANSINLDSAPTFEDENVNPPIIENTEEEIIPIISEEDNSLSITTHEENVTPEENEDNDNGEDIRPIIEEEEQTLNLGFDSNDEQELATDKQTFDEESMLPTVEEEIINNQEANEEESEENSENEEGTIVLSNEIPYEEPTFEMPVFNQSEDEAQPDTEISEETPVDETEENEEQEDISVPEFDFQTFMMPTLNQDIQEGPVTVEPNTETATYIADPTPTKFCGNCGVMLTDDSSICPSCGEPID